MNHSLPELRNTCDWESFLEIVYNHIYRKNPFICLKQCYAARRFPRHQLYAKPTLQPKPEDANNNFDDLCIFGIVFKCYRYGSIALHGLRPHCIAWCCTQSEIMSAGSESSNRPFAYRILPQLHHAATLLANAAQACGIAGTLLS